MRRRTFLGSVAASVGVGGLLGLSQRERLSRRHRLRAVEERQEKRTLLPRWEVREMSGCSDVGYIAPKRNEIGVIMDMEAPE